MSNFIYIPAEGDKFARWLNLSLVADIYERNEKLVLWGANSEEIAELSGQQAAVLRLHLMGRSLSHRPEPELPRIPDPVIVPPAVAEFDQKISARGVVV